MAEPHRPSIGAMTLLPLPSALLLLALLTSCGTPVLPGPATLAPEEALQFRNWVPEAMRFQVVTAPPEGGAETGRWWGSKVSNQALRVALEESLQAAELHARRPEPPARFELAAELLELEQPLIAVGVTVRTAVRYRLLDRNANQRVLYERVVRTEQEAGLGDALLSIPERQRIATERALHASIQTMLRDVVALRP
jgi:hypothetical protein